MADDTHALIEQLDSARMRCSFCGCADHEARVMVASIIANICDACIEQCAEIVARKNGSVDGNAEYASWGGKRCPSASN